MINDSICIKRSLSNKVFVCTNFLPCFFRKQLFLVVVLIFSTSLLANSTTFDFYGYKDVTISGMSGETSFYIKLDHSYDVKKSKLHLNLLYSQALNRSLSYVNVLIDDEPVFGSSLSVLGGTLEIPLDQHATDSKDFLKIGIKTSLSISEDKCRDILSGALWMKVQSSSHIDWVANATSHTKKELSLWDGLCQTTTIAYPDNYTESDVSALSYLYTFIKSQNDMDIQLYPYSLLPETETNLLMVGELTQIPAQYKKHIEVKTTANEGLIYLHQNNDTATASQILFVTGSDAEGYRKAYQSALDENLLKTVFANYTVVRSHKFTRNSYKFESISLSRLNNSKMLLSGTGSLFATYNFCAGNFGGHSGDGNLHLEAKYRPVSLPSHAYYNVYLNQELLYTKELHQDGQVVVDIPFNDYQLLKNNALIIEFLYFPGTGNCDGSSDVFYAQVDAEKSGIEVTVVKNSKHLSFNTFPYLFYTINTKMFVSKNLTQERVKAVAQVMYEFNKNVYKDRFYYPEISFSDQLTAAEISRNGIIAVLSNNDPAFALFSKSLIQVGKDVSLYNNSSQESMFQLAGKNSTAIAQMFFQTQELPVLLITDQGSDPNNLFNLAKVLNLNMADPRSNICIADNSRYVYFNIDSNTMMVEYDHALPEWQILWRKYKIGFLIIGVLFLGASLLFIQRKSKRSTQRINDTRGN